MMIRSASRYGIGAIRSLVLQDSWKRFCTAQLVKRKLRVVASLDGEEELGLEDVSSLNTAFDQMTLKRHRESPPVEYTVPRRLVVVPRERKLKSKRTLHEKNPSKPKTTKEDVQKAYRLQRVESLKTFVNQKDYDNAIITFNELPLQAWTPRAYLHVMKAHTALGNFDAIVSLFESAEQAQLHLSNPMRLHYVLALNKLLCHDQVIDSFSKWHEAKVNLSVPILNAVLAACSHTKNWAVSKQVIESTRLPLEGTSYFHVLATALQDTENCTPEEVLSLAEAAAAKGYPITVTILNKILLAAANTGLRHAVRRSMQLWMSSKHYGALKAGSTEFYFEIALQQLWKKKRYDESIQLFDDLIHLPSATYQFKARIAKDMLVRVASSDVDTSIQLLELMQEHKLGPLSAATCHQLYDGWFKQKKRPRQIAELFDKYSAVTLGWTDTRVSSMIVWGYKQYASGEYVNARLEYQKLMDLLEFTFEESNSLTYVAISYIVRWLYDMGKSAEALATVKAMIDNPSLNLGYRVTELGMFLAWREKEPELVIQLFEGLEVRLSKIKEFRPKRFMVKLASRAYEAVGNLEKFQEMSYILTNEEYRVWNGPRVDDLEQYHKTNNTTYVTSKTL
ncbi:hypothetical protein LEN26_001682 [Aphanomyces euteiches]|nr:hypothetical protein AeMF1_011603 [Aphanomyces euteiches]KAH9160867.1 hypothetical protein LEN26_001682 [Aphanomyces euteiches]KAH9191688.1 hypothetical protein AeNC1_006334 [Aphanomyces euteiches]